MRKLAFVPIYASEKYKNKKILLVRHINLGSVSQLPLQEQVAVPPAVFLVTGMRAVSW